MLVLTPDHAHAEHAVRTLEAGIPTFVEKPLATSVADADRILEAAHRTGTRLYVGHNMRHMPVVRAMRDVIEARHDRRGQGGLVPALRLGEAATTTSRTGTPTAATRRVCCCRRAPTTSTSSTGSPAPTRAGSARSAPSRSTATSPTAATTRTGGWPTGTPSTTGRPPTQRGLNPVVDVEDISMANLRARQRRARLLPAVPLHAGLLAQLHRDRHRGPARELRRRPRRAGQGLEPPHRHATATTPTRSSRSRRPTRPVTAAPTRCSSPSSSASPATAARR